jgi:hypothetical protein
MTEFNKKFKDALRNMTGDDTLENYIYSGGKDPSKEEYFFKKNPNARQLPEEKDNCICGHHIKENCYIKHIITGTVIVVGNCCIKKYLPEENRNKTCSKCNKAHRNRNFDMCNNCRPTCIDCSKYSVINYCGTCSINMGDNKCNNCIRSNTCNDCIFTHYKKCINCKENKILMPTECGDCSKKYWVCPKDTYIKLCKDCYSSRLR